MTIVQKEGKPDLFITLKFNPKWREIVENLGENEKEKNEVVEADLETSLTFLCISALCRAWHTNYRIPDFLLKNWRCYTLSCLCA